MERIFDDVILYYSHLNQILNRESRSVFAQSNNYF